MVYFNIIYYMVVLTSSGIMLTTQLRAKQKHKTTITLGVFMIIMSVLNIYLTVNGFYS